MTNMKAAIASVGESTESKMDQRFGRAPFFIVYDTGEGSREVLSNPYASMMEGAGVAAARLLAGKGVGMVISGDFGQKVKTYFDQQKIGMVSLPDGSKTVQQVIGLLKRNYP